MKKDPVCLMDMDENAEFKKEYNNKIYYFCSTFCLEKFTKEPEIYLDRHKDFLDKMEIKEEET